MNSQKQSGLENLQEFKKHRLYKYLISLFIVAVSGILQHLVWEYIKPAPFLLFYPAVILACLYGDGNFAILLSCIFGQYFFVSNIMAWPTDYVRLVFFLMATIMIRKVIRQQAIEKLKAVAAVERLEESERDLKLEREAREKFVSLITHDLQTPITAVKLNLELIKRKNDDKSAVIKALGKSFANLTRIENMIQNLLDANRIKAGEKLHLECTEGSMNELITQTIKDLIIIHGERFQTRNPEDIIGCWNTDGVRRILENLCNNAVKYGDNSPITVSSDVVTDGVILSVNNKGPVIPETEIKKLFGAYHRSDAALHGSKKGWGIGLTLVKGLAEAHEGNVQVKSNEKDGTTFSVYLPKDFTAKK